MAPTRPLKAGSLTKLRTSNLAGATAVRLGEAVMGLVGDRERDEIEKPAFGHTWLLDCGTAERASCWLTACNTENRDGTAQTVGLAAHRITW